MLADSRGKEGGKMTSVEATEYIQVLDTVRNWPPDLRLTLLQDLLQTFAPRVERAGDSEPTWQQALGLLNVAQPAPEDADIQQWLDEHRLEKYG
jgi:hypothetical protein